VTDVKSLDNNDGQEVLVPELFNIASACLHLDEPGFDFTQTALIIDDADTGVSSMTYGQLNDESERFAMALRELGVVAGERVMLWLPNCLEFPVSFFATLKLGAVAVPASLMLTGDEIDYLAADSGARVLVTTPTLWSRLYAHNPAQNRLEQVVLVGESVDGKAALSQAVHCFNALLEAQLPSIEMTSMPSMHPTRADDAAYLVYTSGTTGYPKGVLHAHRALIGRLPASRYWFDYAEEGDRILHSGKFNWTYVLGTALMDPLYLGKSVVLYEGEAGAETWPRLIAKHECSIFIGVPTIYRQIVQKTDAVKADVPSLRYCMSAGEHLSDEMLSAWRARFEQDIYEAIGMSECSYYLSQHSSRPIRPGAAGFPQQGHQIALLDKDMNPVGVDEEGMLCIQLEDPGLFIEYWQNEQETQNSRRNGYFMTGDYARRDEDGYIWFLGRKDDLINSFGYRLSPHEIERVLKAHPHVADCVVIGEEVDAGKVVVTACVIPAHGLTIINDDLKAYAVEHLASYKVPKSIRIMETFPRTANGKVMRRALKQGYTSSH